MLEKFKNIYKNYVKEWEGVFFAKNAAYTFTVRVIGALIAYVLSLLLARIMGAHSYGIYSYVRSWTVLLTTLSCFGLEQILTKYVSIYNDKGDLELLRGLLTRSNQLVLLTGFVVLGGSLIVVLALKGRLDRELFMTFIVIFTGVPVFALAGLRYGTLRGFKKVANSLIPDLIVRPVVIIILSQCLSNFLNVKIGAPVAGLFYILGSLSAFILVSIWVKKSLPRDLSILKPNFRTKEWLKVSLSIVIYTILHRILSQIDVIMIGSLLGGVETGVYVAAKRVGDLVLFGLQSMSVTAAPYLSSLFSRKLHDKLKKFVLLSTFVSVIFALPVGTGMIIWGDIILKFYGSEFITGYHTLIIFSAGMMLRSFFGPAPILLIMTGLEKTAVWGTGVSLITSVAVNMLLIPKFGILGAAVTSLLVTLLWHVAASIIIYRRINVNPTIFRNYGELLKKSE